MITYEWRGAFAGADVDGLDADGGAHPARDWWTQVNRHSLGWACAKRAGTLVGFENVAWDGAAHAFVLDTRVATAVRRQGVGRRLVAHAADQARAAGCEWLHVDFEDHLRPCYLGSCGFRPTHAGLIAL